MIEGNLVGGGDVDEAHRVRSAGLPVPGMTAWAPAGTRCNFCSAAALVDGKQRFSDRWAYMCPEHYRGYGLCLGEGFGQVLFLELPASLEMGGESRR